MRKGEREGREWGVTSRDHDVIKMALFGGLVLETMCLVLELADLPTLESQCFLLPLFLHEHIKCVAK